MTLAQLTDDALEFVSVYHLATLSTPLPDESIHVVPVGFTWHDGLVRIITSRGSQKVLNVRRTGTASVCQVERARWITFSGAASILEDADSVRQAEELYAGRYRQPRPNPERVVIAIDPTRILASRGLIVASA